ncbi:hypothetical protein H2200_008305 [Cladophialophora chaetospira]|uniref:Uncharacterized protein n=1 Tax=Cladophialophora chaetospira TaxID=386627 RepID=A0AA38X5I2_9EURO|nr:hypothetical protein H2200_008305 [Cladophialophora chaetospira]
MEAELLRSVVQEDEPSSTPTAVIVARLSEVSFSFDFAAVRIPSLWYEEDLSPEAGNERFADILGESVRAEKAIADTVEVVEVDCVSVRAVVAAADALMKSPFRISVNIFSACDRGESDLSLIAVGLVAGDALNATSSFADVDAAEVKVGAGKPGTTALFLPALTAAVWSHTFMHLASVP